MRLTVEVNRDYAHAADKVWKTTGDFGGLKDWLPGITACRVEGSGAADAGGNAVRIVDVMDGSVTRESLQSYDAAQHSYTYNLLEAKGIDARAQYRATFTVTPTGANACRIDWVAGFDVPDDFPPEKAERARQRVLQMYGMCLQYLDGVLARG